MRRTATLLIICGLALGSSACLKHTYSLGSGAPDGEIVYKHWHHHWLFGLIRPDLQKQLDLSELCPSGDLTVHQEMSFVNGLVDVLTWFIYTPTTVTIQCEQGELTEVELSAETVARITRDARFLDYVADLAPERLRETRLALVETMVPEEDLAEAPARR